MIEQFGEEGDEEEDEKEMKSLGPLLLTQGQNEEEEQEGKWKWLFFVETTKKKAIAKRQKVTEPAPQKVQAPTQARTREATTKANYPQVNYMKRGKGWVRVFLINFIFKRRPMIKK